MNLVILNRGDKLPGELKKNSLLIFNATGEGLLDEFFESKYSNTPIIINDLNSFSSPEALNMGLRATREDVSYLGVEEEADVTMCNGGFFISRKVIDAIGLFDNVFAHKLYLIDFAHRARIAGFTVVVRDDILEQELNSFTDPLVQLNYLSFGSKWNIPDTITPDRFWEWLLNQRYEWKLEMKC